MIAKEEGQNEVRDQMGDLMRTLLLGPIEEDEILLGVPPGSGPLDYYLTGILWPQNERISGEDDEQTSSACGEHEGSVSEDSGAPLYSAMRPSSIGLTCAIDGLATAFNVEIRGARYRRLEPAQDHSPDEDLAGTDWERQPFEYRLEIPGDESRYEWKTSEFLTGDGQEVTDRGMSIHVRRRPDNDRIIVTASFINEAIRDPFQRDEICLFQTKIMIRPKENSGGKIISRPGDPPPGDEREARIVNTGQKT